MHFRIQVMPNVRLKDRDFRSVTLKFSVKPINYIVYLKFPHLIRACLNGIFQKSTLPKC